MMQMHLRVVVGFLLLLLCDRDDDYDGDDYDGDDYDDDDYDGDEEEDNDRDDHYAFLVLFIYPLSIYHHSLLSTPTFPVSSFDSTRLNRWLIFSFPRSKMCCLENR